MRVRVVRVIRYLLTLLLFSFFSHLQLTMSADLAQKLQPHAKEIVIALGVILLALVLLAGKKKEKPVLDPVEFRPFKLIKKTQLSKNTYR